MMLNNSSPPHCAPLTTDVIEEHLRQIATISGKTESTSLGATVGGSKSEASRNGLAVAVRLCQLNLSLTEQTLQLAKSATSLALTDAHTHSVAAVPSPSEVEQLIAEAEALRRSAVTDIWRLGGKLSKLAKELEAHSLETSVRRAEATGPTSYGDIRTVLTHVARQIDCLPTG